MTIFQSIIVILGCFILGYLFLSATFKCFAGKKYESASIGVMLSLIVCIFLFKVIMLM